MISLILSKIKVIMVGILLLACASAIGYSVIMHYKYEGIVKTLESKKQELKSANKSIIDLKKSIVILEKNIKIKSKALKDRVNDIQSLRESKRYAEKKLNEALEGNSDWAHTPVPDSVRNFLNKRRAKGSDGN